MALTNGLVAPWHVQRGTFILSLSPFPFYFFPPFLPLSFFFPSSSLSSSFSPWFIQWILFPFLFFSSSFFITRCAVSSFDSCDGKLSLSRESCAVGDVWGIIFPLLLSLLAHRIFAKRSLFTEGRRRERESWGNKWRNKGISFSWKTENGRVACCLWFERWKNIGGSHVGSNLFRILLHFVPSGDG